jgi:hypothetical protein
LLIEAQETTVLDPKAIQADAWSDEREMGRQLSAWINSRGTSPPPKPAKLTRILGQHLS